MALILQIWQYSASFYLSIKGQFCCIGQVEEWRYLSEDESQDK
jgi:hypothetical protein